MGFFSRLFGNKSKEVKDDKNDTIIKQDVKEKKVEDLNSKPQPASKPKATTSKTVKKESTVAPKANTPKPNDASNINNVENSTVKNQKADSDTDIIIDSDAETVQTKATKTGRFEIKKSKDGRYVFNLYASNHVIIATSQVYSSSTSAVNGINSIIANAEKAGIEDQSLKKYDTLPYPKWEIYVDKGNQYRFRLCASNGSCIVHSQGYTSKASCKNGIESIIKFAKDAQIDKIYLKKD